MRRNKKGLSAFSYSGKRYREEAGFYSGLWQKYRREVVLKLIGENKKVLDVGCYDGTYLELINNRNNEVYGIEASSGPVKICREKGLNVTKGDLERHWSFEDKFFDVVYAGEVIEHIVDTDFFISEARRVLKKDGSLILTTPNSATLGKRLLLILGKNPYREASFSYPPGAVGHLREYSFDLLKNFSESYGFVLQEFTSDVVNIPFLPSDFKRLLAKIFPRFGRSLIMKFSKSK